LISYAYSTPIKETVDVQIDQIERVLVSAMGNNLEIADDPKRIRMGVADIKTGKRYEIRLPSLKSSGIQQTETRKSFEAYRKRKMEEQDNNRRRILALIED
jgi:hypothetical protein